MDGAKPLNWSLKAFLFLKYYGRKRKNIAFITFQPFLLFLPRYTTNPSM